ncbi:MAG: TIGR02588 family protein [Cyanobacteria bacterium P01_G01_bin.38]
MSKLEDGVDPIKAQATPEPAITEPSPEALLAKRSLAEWITLTISTAILIGLVGLVLYDWQINQNRPPLFQIEFASAQAIDNHYYVPFVIKNTGGQVARTVQVSAELRLDNAPDETGAQDIDFLSANERKRGSFVFDHDPNQGQLTVRVASFRLP